MRVRGRYPRKVQLAPFDRLHDFKIGSALRTCLSPTCPMAAVGRMGWRRTPGHEPTFRKSRQCSHWCLSSVCFRAICRCAAFHRFL